MIAVAMTMVTAVIGVVGHRYRFELRQVSIEVSDGQRTGVLALPRGADPRGVVLMLHGDGPVNATNGGLYEPLFEAAADVGWATLSWSKAGVAGSSGNWLMQSMDDRAVEVSNAIDWMRGQPGFETAPLVLWGASQAGWVLPKVVAARTDVTGVIAVGTAINWLSQGRYNLDAELDDEGADPASRRQAIAESDLTRELLTSNAGYDEYLSATSDPNPMSADRWTFVLRNYRADATDDLRAAAARNLPWRLMVGGRDRNVDVAETERVYRDILGYRLRVEHFAAAHSLARPIMEQVDQIGWPTAVLWPRALFAPGVLAGHRAALESLK